MRTITAEQISNTISEMCIKANMQLPNDVYNAICNAQKMETFDIAKKGLDILQDNINDAKEQNLPICQDTGMACIFAEIGQDVHIDGDFENAVNEGVSIGYESGYLRKSVVYDPLDRKNTKDNTPAVINVKLVKGDKIKFTVAPKGFGSENMSRLCMLNPSDGAKGVEDFVLETVRLAGSNPCPPIVVGVGIGGTFDKVALLAKQALLRQVDSKNPNEFYAKMEEDLLEKINKIGIGPQGFGGKTTALGVNIETFATHIAGLPVAVNINCHVTRHVEVIL